MVRWLTLGLLLVSLAAWSNGGPVEWNGPTGLGDGTPRGSSPVKLLREDLKLTVGADPNRYSVEARYTLSNPGAPVTVRYGVPITVAQLGDAEVSTAELQKAGASVSIELGGAKKGCKVEMEQGQVSLPVPDGILDEGPPQVRAWCVTDLTIPSGAEVPLTLRYEAETLYVDGETSKSAMVSYASRDLIYPLWPAGGWAGKPTLNITLDAKGWDGMTKVVQPAGVKSSGGVHTWTLPNADLRALGSVVVRIDADRVLGHKKLVATNAETGAYTMKLGARASSALSGGSYGAEMLLDGKGETAWCEGKDGDGVGEWVELTVARGPTQAYCQLEGLVIVPGYAKSQAVWDNNNRISALTLGPCGGAGERVSLDVAKRYDASARLVYMSMGMSDLFQSLSERAMKSPKDWCVRVTLQEVQRGAKYQDTCISEIAGLVNCG